METGTFIPASNEPQSIFPRAVSDAPRLTPGRSYRTAADVKSVAKRPASGGESCKAGFFLAQSIQAPWHTKAVPLDPPWP